MGYYEGEVGNIAGGGGNNGGSGWFGGDAWAAIILFALIFGWGRNGNNWGGQGGGMSVDLNGIATRNDLCSEFNFNNLENAVRGIQNGLCDGFYAQNTNILNGFAGVQQTLCQGFGGVNSAITTAGYQSQLATNNLGYQLQNCCCDIERGIDRLACQSATDTAAIIQSGSNNTQRILDYLCNEKIEALRAENVALTNQLSQNAQTRTLIDTLLPVAKPAYLTCSPYASAYGYPYAFNSGCGCGCGTTIQ